MQPSSGSLSSVASIISDAYDRIAWGGRPECRRRIVVVLECGRKHHAASLGAQRSVPLQENHHIGRATRLSCCASQANKG